ncbi:pentapeptide repeat-containing protein [Waterburya agarophytonicola K14]|uniref:Pentapeptide repeat-containing protein n=1 Tax=Waterburya agarophytonicola KI4 TaxID=2874699 RepID=A0A964FF25_9CYAN|nr:pentapeptide repeat-containing protein [Waterburya agarophytonicola]MCC0176547.1 pentapeptide repeat-containing protein [Waterburya agarophytonicola KI4]
MKSSLFTTIALISTITIAIPTPAESLTDLTQLLNTKKCSQCDLSNSGLVQTNLVGADLSQANLVGANLSQANLTGADLRGANLTGASFYGANLTGANLAGVNLTSTDLRNAYLNNANLTGANLDVARMEGIKGIAENAATAEQFHRWGVREADLGNYNAAVQHYRRAIKIDPEFAPAYLGLGIIQYNFDHRVEAKKNTKIAAKLFKEQQHELGYKTAVDFQQQMALIQEAEENMAQREGGMGHVGKFMGSVGSLLLQLLL